MRLAILLISFTISHLLITTTSLLFFKGFNLAAPFLLIYDSFRPVWSLFKGSFASPLFEYSIYFTISYIAIAIIPPLAYNSGRKKGKYGYARFADRSLLKKMGLNFKKGIILGKLSGLFKDQIIKTSEPRSTLIIAPTGAGKTAGFIIPTLLTLDNSIVAVDIKGELFAKTHKKRRQMGHKILIFDPDPEESEEELTIKFNPFATNQLPKKTEKLTAYIGNIANIIFVKEGQSKKGDYFFNAMKALFCSIALYLIYRKGWTSITQIKNLTLENDDIYGNFKTISEELKEELSKLNLNNKESRQKEQIIRHILRGVAKITQIKNADEQLSGVIGSFNTKLEAFSDLDIENMINCKESSITIDDLRDEKTTIYVRVSIDDLERLNPLINLFFESLASSLMSKEANDEDNQVTFILDEFANLGKVAKLVRATTISRSFKLNQVFILQDLAQINSIYTPDERHILESNTAYKVILKQNNYKTACEISQTIGNKTETRESESKQKGGKSVSKSEEGISLVTAQDIMNLDKDKCLILVEGFSANPILANIPWYYKNKI